MEQEKKEAFGPENMAAEWMKNTAAFWEEVLKMQGGAAAGFQMPGFGKTQAGQNLHKTWETGSKIFNSYMKKFNEPGAVEELFKGMDSLPDFVTALTRQAWEGVSDLHRQWMEKASRLGKESKAYNFEDIDQETFRAIRELYEREFQKFLNIPALGLTRFYQERFNKYIDKYNLFQTAVGEFLYVLYAPIEKSNQVLQKKIEELAESGDPPQDFKEYYNMWVKILEGHYMTLLKSKEYLQTMDNLIAALVEYKSAREDFLSDVLQQFPVPTQREMDELYKDYNELKKTVRALSRQVQDLSTRIGE